MGSGSETIQTYRTGDTVRLPIVVEDASGIERCDAMFYRLKDSEQRESYDFDNYIRLSGDGQRQKKARIDLTATLTHQDPDTYSCAWIQTQDIVGNVKTEENLDPRPRFRIARTEGADYDPPKIINIGDPTK
jgi:hypothetical protein